MTNFLDVLSTTKALVWPEIEKYLNSLSQFPQYCVLPEKYNDLVKYHQQIVSNYSIRQGKYLRPTLVLLIAQAMGVSAATATKTAAAMQLSEDWILNHDDIEDDSVKRRGQPCLHRQIGKELAINAGDGLHVLMWKMLIDNLSLVDPAVGTNILNEFVALLNRTVFGQTVEIKWIKDNNFNLSDEDIFMILDGKTGYYTIGGPLRLGAILANATIDQLDKIYQFSIHLGRAFQMTDDLLDLTTDFSGLKKKCDDLYEGKRSIMLVHLFRQLQNDDQQKLTNIMALPREQKTEEQISWILSQMEQHGSLDYARTLIQQSATKCRQLFDQNLGFISIQPFRDHIKLAIDFIVDRQH